MTTKSTPLSAKEKEYFEIRLESIGGLGANLCGKMLGELGALYLKLNASNFSSYGSEKRGSPVKSHIRWCAPEKELRLSTPVMNPNLLGIFHEALLSNYPLLTDATEQTCTVLHTSLSPEEAAKKYQISTGRLFCIDALEISMTEKSRVNMVMLGALAAAADILFSDNSAPGIPLETVEELCKNTVGKKYPQLIEANLKGLRKGYQHIKEQEAYYPNELRSDTDASTKALADDKPPSHVTTTASGGFSSYVWGYDNAPLGGINPRIGSTVSNDLSASREGYIPLFQKEKCINCGLCDSTCPDMVFQFFPGIYRGKEAMVNEGLDYAHCKGCLRCVEICPTNALVLAYEKDFPDKPHDRPNKNLLTSDFAMENRGADSAITSDSYLTEQQIGGGVL